MTDPRTRAILRADLRHVWHPFTQMREWPRDEILAIDRARGVWLVDTEGRRYLDGVSSLWCNVHGHRVPEIDRAIRRQLSRVAHSTFLGLTHEPGARLAAKLARIAPRGLTRVFYSDSGSEAVEVALKIAYQFWQNQGGAAARRRRFVGLANAYHGDTLGAVSVGGIGLLHARFRPLLFPAIHVPAPYAYRCPRGHSLADCGAESLEAMERTLRRHRDRVAGVILEPLIQCAAGMIVHPPGFLGAVRRLCDRFGVLLIADEVATGFGRTGRMFACEHEGVTPDLLCLAKGLTGGTLPLAATLATERVYRAFLGRHAQGRQFFHGHTYTANPLACAAALGNLEAFRRRRTLASLPAKIAAFRRALDGLRDLPAVGDVRTVGLMAGIELVADRTTKRAFPPERRTGHRVILEARRRGVILRPLGDVVVLFPPPAMGPATLARLVAIARDSIAAAAR